MENERLQSGNINALWIDNIYQNLKNLENMERLANEGCLSILEYASIPIGQNKIVLGDLQYKNLRMMVSEFDLLITDLTPVIEEKDITLFINEINNIKKVINNRKLFVKESTSHRNIMMSSEITPFFNETLIYLRDLKRKLIKQIEGLLYIKQEADNRKKW